MGLSVYVKGLPYDKTFECGYITFHAFRKALANAYNPELGQIYEELTDISSMFNDSEENEKTQNYLIKRYNKICNDDLDIFLFYSDCDGKITWQEAKKILKVIEPLSMDMLGHNYGDVSELPITKVTGFC